MGRKKVHVNFQLDPLLDKDILNFMKNQENKTRFFRKIIRILIDKYGNKDLSILPVEWEEPEKWGKVLKK
jgi:hypothetical protein